MNKECFEGISEAYSLLSAIDPLTIDADTDKSWTKHRQQWLKKWEAVLCEETPLEPVVEADAEPSPCLFCGGTWHHRDRCFLSKSIKRTA